jgi:hypothetical protein
MRLRRRRGPRKAPCETPTEVLDAGAGPAKLDLPVLGVTMRSSEVKPEGPLRYLTEVLDGGAGPAKLDLPVLGVTMRSSEMKTEGGGGAWR